MTVDPPAKKSSTRRPICLFYLENHLLHFLDGKLPNSTIRKIVVNKILYKGFIETANEITRLCANDFKPIGSEYQGKFPCLIVQAQQDHKMCT